MSSGELVENFNQRSQSLLGLLKRVPPLWWRRGAVGLLSLWLTYSLAQGVWVLTPAPSLPEPPLTLPRNAVFTDTSSSGSAGVNIAELKSYELFGKPGAVVEQVVELIPEEVLPDTKLNLVLRGVAPSDTESSSNAIIADGARQSLFFPGEELTIGPRGVKLVQVKIDRVVLNNNGNHETLWLYKDDDFKRGNTGFVQASSRRPPIPTRQASPEVEETSELTAEFVNGLRPEENQLVPTAEQIKSIDDVIGISMYREGGQLVGFRIRPKRNRQIFDELGLQPNDVVTAVNNVGLTDTSQAMQLYRSLSQTTQVRLEILRDGVTTTVDINLDDFQQ